MHCYGGVQSKLFVLLGTYIELYYITGGSARGKKVKPKTWRILGFADVISMTTGPLSSCKLPLTNCDPNDLTEAFPLHKKTLFSIGVAALCFCMFVKQIWSSTNQ